MNKGNRVIASSVLFVISGIAIGYGFTAIDFAFSNDRWSMNNDRTSTFPLIGNIPTETAFVYGFVALLFGLLAIIAASYIAIINYSTIKNIPIIAAGVLAIGWSLWGIAFSMDTAQWRVQHDLDEVGIPCLADNADASSQCTFTSEEWLFINFGLMILGLLLIVIGSKRSRFITKHNFQA